MGVNKDSYLVLDKLPPEYDSRVKAMEASGNGATRALKRWVQWGAAVRAFLGRFIDCCGRLMSAPQTSTATLAVWRSRFKSCLA